MSISFLWLNWLKLFQVNLLYVRLRAIFGKIKNIDLQMGIKFNFKKHMLYALFVLYLATPCRLAPMLANRAIMITKKFGL